MKSFKLKLSSVIALFVVFAATLGAFFGTSFRKANAYRPVTVGAGNIFTVSSLDEADVWSHKIAGETEEQDEYYTMLVVKQTDGLVNYKKNIAYQWYYNSSAPVQPEEGEENEETVSTFEKGEGWFNMEIGFEIGDNETLDFERFILKFESQQYSQTKDNKTANYIVFVPTADKKHVNVIITSEQERDLWVVADSAKALSVDRIKIEFTERNQDKYGVSVTSDGVTESGEFENVGGTYARYSSSTTTPVTPLSFSAEYAEPVEGEEDGDIEAASYARMVLYNLNGQSFKLTSVPATENGHTVSGTVDDDTPPVLCLDKGLSFIEEGEEITFNYTVIDVLASSPSTTTHYFMLTNENAAADKDFNANDYSDGSPYRKVKSDEAQLMIPHVKHYVPVAENLTAGVYDAENFKVTAAVKIYLELLDTTSTGGTKTEILLDWYVNDKYIVNINNNGTQNKYIAVAKDKSGASFAYTDENADWEKLIADYQTKVDAAAEDLKAGSKNYFYLPSVEGLLSDNVTGYSDLNFSIFYTTDGKSFQSNTGKSASNLSINLTKRGTYIYTVLVTDAAGNGMYYIEKDSNGNTVMENGKPKLVQIDATSSNIQSMFEDKEDLYRYLPWFTFNVKSSELSIEDPEEQDTAYVGAEYNVESFDINGGSYNTKYTLYRFMGEKFYAANGYAMTYDEFMKNKNTLKAEHRDWFETIKPLSSMNEEDEDYEIYSPYAWDDSSLKFTPQDANSFYLIECVVTSSENTGLKETAYMGISSSAKANSLKGENTWFKDNLTSVILLSIAGASLIGIILLLVIKPKNKEDIDEVYEKSFARSKKSKKSKAD